MMSLYGLITIVDRGKSGAVQRIYQTHQVHRSLVLRGHGTANSEIMDMLGLDEPQKELLLTVTTRGNCREILGDLGKSCTLTIPGRGLPSPARCRASALPLRSWWRRSTRINKTP